MREGEKDEKMREDERKGRQTYTVFVCAHMLTCTSVCVLESPRYKSASKSDILVTALERLLPVA